MRKFLIILLIVLIILIIVGVVWYIFFRSGDEFKDWKTYRNESLGFEMKIPNLIDDEDIYIENYGNAIDFFYSYMKAGIGEKVGGDDFYIEIKENLENLSIKNWVQKIKKCGDRRLLSPHE